MHTTQQSYQNEINKKSLFLANPEPEPFLTKITAPARDPAPAKYGGSTAPDPGSTTLIINIQKCIYTKAYFGFKVLTEYIIQFFSKKH